MSIVIESSNNKKEFNKTIINIGTNPKCDFVINPGFDFLVTIQYDKNNEICTVINNVKSPNLLLNGEVLQKKTITNVAKIELKGSTEYIIIQVGADISIDSDYSMKVSLSDEALEELFSNDANSVGAKMEHLRQPIEKARISILKQISYPISDLKAKIKNQVATSVLLHMGLFITCLLSAFAIANYLTGLAAQEAAGYVYLATNIPVWIGYTIVTLAICLMLKQGVYLHLTEKRIKSKNISSSVAKNFMIVTALLFITAVYVVNLAYYSAISDFFSFALFITVFFVGAMTAIAIACGYFKENGAIFKSVLHKYEFREDFEEVQKAYRIWIERYLNNFTTDKIKAIKDRLFMLQLRTMGETLLGLATAPFLAFGVSNTLAMCFPEFAGWVRISGFRFSPIFLILATCLIIFAFFMFVFAFLSDKKIKASEIIKQDGFVDYRHHGVSIYGLEGVKKLESDRNRFLAMAIAIVFIEFTMNISYFMTEIGGSINGVFTSFNAALLPTALLIAETILLASSKFDVYICEELIAKLDKE